MTIQKKKHPWCPYLWAKVSCSLPHRESTAWSSCCPAKRAASTCLNVLLETSEVCEVHRNCFNEATQPFLSSFWYLLHFAPSHHMTTNSKGSQATTRAYCYKTRSKPAQVFCTFFTVRISLICQSETMLNKLAFQQFLQSLELCICFRLFCCCCFGNFIQTPSNGASFGETWTAGIRMHRTCVTRCCIQRLAVIPLSTCLWVALFSSANSCCTYFSSPATSRHR